jgi:hypothetical protein
MAEMCGIQFPYNLVIQAETLGSKSVYSKTWLIRHSKTKQTKKFIVNNLYNSILKGEKFIRKIGISPTGTICNRLSRQHPHKLPFHAM